MSILLGAIADDFTGATDLANTLVRQGMRTVQCLGVPSAEFNTDDVDAVVVALKSRTAPVDQAIDESIAALEWLQNNGCHQTIFKYCSTFDSTEDGNIGPVAEALMRNLNSDFTIACPAFPENQRTIFKGYLFVGDVLLNESGMQNHPLTPMTDANLVRVLDAQTTGNVGLVPWSTVNRGTNAIRRDFETLKHTGLQHAIVDAVTDADLFAIGEACADLPLITGGSGIALGLPENFRRQGLLETNNAADALAPVGGLEAVISGSCSVATRGQVAHMAKTAPTFHVDANSLQEDKNVVANALAFADQHLEGGPILIYSSASPEDIAVVQEKLGRDKAGAMVEDALAKIARGLVARGVRKLVVAGGETSGAVVSRIGVTSLRIGPQIDPGVPWTLSINQEVPPVALALKSGNFGEEDFFTKAFQRLA